MSPVTACEPGPASYSSSCASHGASVRLRFVFLAALPPGAPRVACASCAGARTVHTANRGSRVTSRQHSIGFTVSQHVAGRWPRRQVRRWISHTQGSDFKPSVLSPPARRHQPPPMRWIDAVDMDPARVRPRPASDLRRDVAGMPAATQCQHAALAGGRTLGRPTQMPRRSTHLWAGLIPWSHMRHVHGASRSRAVLWPFTPSSAAGAATTHTPALQRCRGVSQ